MSTDSIAIVGLGAMGGSLALELHAAGSRITGYDIDASSIAQARRAGLSAELWHGQRLSCDVVVIAVPVRRTVNVLAALAQRTDYRLITDMGSTKRLVVEAAERQGLGSCFVGSHPLAGTHETGFAAARRGIFSGKTVFVCESRDSGGEALQSAQELWRDVGALTQQISADEHDARMAWLSHLPQLTANALALTLKSAHMRRSQLGTGGSDMTRLAASDPELWLDIAAANADMLDEPLGCMIEALIEIRLDLRSGNEERLFKLLQASRAWSDG